MVTRLLLSRALRSTSLALAGAAAPLCSRAPLAAGRGSLLSRRLVVIIMADPGAEEGPSRGSRGKKAPQGTSSGSRRWTDGKQIVEQKKKQRKKWRKKSDCLDDSCGSLIMEMPFAEADIEEEFSTTSRTKANIKKKRKRTTGRENEEDNLIKKKKNQDRPNYFISIPIINPQISDGIQALQDTIIEKDGRLSKAMVHYGSLHVTLLVMHLSSETAVDNAVGAFLKSKVSIEELLQGKPLDLSFQGTDHFRNQVGFVKLTENESTATLLKIAESVKNIFLDKGICIEDERSFKPHLTFMKLSKSPKLRKQGVKKIDPSLFENFKNHYFGDESMTCLDLCSMFKKKQSNGYYHCESSITIGEKRGAEPDDAELLSLSKRLVENAVLKAVQQYLEETQNKNRQIDCGTTMKNEEPALGNNIENENENRK